MRRIILLAVFLVLAMVNTSFAGALMVPKLRDNVPEVLSMVGEVKELQTNGVLVVPSEKNRGAVLAKVFDSTYIYNAEKNEFVGIDTLKIGQKITVYHSAAMTRSIPPQTTSFAIVIGEGFNLPRYYRVNQVSKTNEQLEFLTNNGSLIVRSKTVQKELNKKDELLVWHGPVALSLPGQTNATKIINLSSMKTGKITLHLNAGVLAVNGQEIQVTQGKKTAGAYRVYEQGKSYMLPLVPVAKALGLDVMVNNQTDTVIVQSGSEKIELVPGSKQYNFAGNKIKLTAAPKAKYGQIMVPMEFFSKLLNIKIKLLDMPV